MSTAPGNSGNLLEFLIPHGNNCSLLEFNLWYGDGAGNTVEENSSVFSLV